MPASQTIIYLVFQWYAIEGLAQSPQMPRNIPRVKMRVYGIYSKTGRARGQNNILRRYYKPLTRLKYS
jgi:hypothetical protein